MSSVTIGLDIGSSAVRAAEMEVGKDGRRVLRRYGQVGIPHGYVKDGEVNNVAGVAQALRRLWSEVGFSRTDVVLGISGPRVFVRQADVPAMAAEELRSSLQFDAQDMIPIPMEDASFDFSVLGPPSPDGDGQPSQKILLVAAHRDLLRSYMDVLKGAGLTARVMDAAPFALLRAVPSEDSEEGVEVICSIGAELTTVAVREGGIPRFIRSLTIGGGQLTETIANRMHVETMVAERLKRGAVSSDTPQVAQARRAMTPDMRELAEEVRATIDFFVSQAGGGEVSRLLVTGGASQTEGLAASLRGDLPTSVRLVEPLAGVDTSGLGFDDGQLARMSATSATAIGLALWPTDSPLIRLSVLPEEVAAVQRTRRTAMFAGAGVAGVAVILAGAGVAQMLSVHSAQSKARAEQASAAALQTRVSRLQSETKVHSEVKTQEGLVSTALQGDVDWVRVIGQLAAIMPPDLSLTSMTAGRTVSSGTSASPSPSSATSSSDIGSVTFNVQGTGGLQAAAAWLEQLAADPDLSGVTVSGITVQANGGSVQFTSTATLTPKSESNRAQEVKP